MCCASVLSLHLLSARSSVRHFPPLLPPVSAASRPPEAKRGKGGRERKKKEHRPGRSRRPSSSSDEESSSAESRASVGCRRNPGARVPGLQIEGAPIVTWRNSANEDGRQTFAPVRAFGALVSPTASAWPKHCDRVRRQQHRLGSPFVDVRRRRNRRSRTTQRVDLCSCAEKRASRSRWDGTLFFVRV